MAKVEELVAKFKAETSDFNRKIDGVQREMRDTAKEINAVDVKTKKLSSTTADTSRSMSSNYKMIGIAASAAAVAVGAFSVKVGSEMVMSQKRIEAMLGSAEKSKIVMDSLRQAGYDTGASVQELAKSYGKLAVFVENGSLSLQESLRISKGLTGTSLALGASTEQLNQVMFGFSQAMGSGIVRAEEFNQVTEPLPGIINRMEREAGLATGQLRKMINTGQITSDMFKDLLIPALESFTNKSKDMVDTFQAQSGILSNTLAALGEDIYDYLNKPLSDVLATANEVLQKFVSLERASKTEVQSRLNQNISRQQDIAQMMSGDLQVRNPKVRAELSNEMVTLRMEEEKIIGMLQKASEIAPKKDASSVIKKSTGGVKRRSGRKSNNISLGSRSSESSEDPLFKSIIGDARSDIGNFNMEVINEFSLIQDAFGNMQNDIVSGFITMSQSGKTSFKDMARSIINDLQSIIVRTLAMKAITGIGNAIAGSFAGGPVSTGGAGVGFGAHGSSGFISGARANGGAVMSNKSYLVGERGPEILTMGGMGGHITSNQQASNGGGSGTNQVINIDARGAQAGVSQEINRAIRQLRKEIPNIALASVKDGSSRVAGGFLR